jgi:hypothetical protein
MQVALTGAGEAESGCTVCKRCLCILSAARLTQGANAACITQACMARLHGLRYMLGIAAYWSKCKQSPPLRQTLLCHQSKVCRGELCACTCSGSKNGVISPSRRSNMPPHMYPTACDAKPGGKATPGMRALQQRCWHTYQCRPTRLRSSAPSACACR